MSARRLAIIALLAVAPSQYVGAQVVRGTVVDAADVPVPGAVVALVDPAGAVAARALTDEEGRYRVAAPAAGTYRVRTLRIGYRPVMTSPFAVGVGEEHVERLVVGSVALTLAAVHVEERRACRLNADSTAATFAVWEQVRAALAATQLTAGARAVRATTVDFERTLDRDFRRVREQSATVTSGYVTQPWKTIPPTTLRRGGFVVDDANGLTTYYAPGLDLLGSDGFVEDHCFRLAPSRDTAQIALAFTPTLARTATARNRAVVDIAGTISVDRATSELRGLEYRYVNLDAPRADHAGGALRFVRLRDGGWAIASWSIRMPALTPFVLSNGKREVRVGEIRVTGGELALALRGADTLYARAPLALAGTIADSLTDAPIAGARVALVGTAQRAVTDAAGRFALPDVLPGSYALDVRTPSLDSLGASHQQTVEFAPFTDAAPPPLRVRVLGRAQIAALLCPGRVMAGLGAPDGIVLGTVYGRGDSTPRAHVAVATEWVETTLRSDGSGVDRRPRWLESHTDAGGAFRLCGVPRATALTLRASDDSAGSGRAEYRLDADRIGRVTLTLDPTRVAGATFVGRVLADSTRQAIADAEIAFPELSLSARTDARGTFRLGDVPSGAQHVIVRRFGYGPLDTHVTFVPNRTTERTIYLSRVAVLDSVLVTETRDRAMDDFEANRRVGLGHFLTRAQLDSIRGTRLAAALEKINGIHMITGQGGKAWLASQRAAHNSLMNDKACEHDEPFQDRSRSDPPAPCGICYAQVYLDDVLLSRMQIPNIDRFAPEQLEAVEYYAGPATTPARYGNMGSQCGVLVLHTRRTP